MKKKFTLLFVLLFAFAAYAQVSPVIISEVFYDTPLEEDIFSSPLDHHNGEFIELFNPGSNAIDVSNWSIRDGKQNFFFPKNTIMFARSVLVIAFKHPATDFKLNNLFPEINNSAGGDIIYQSNIWFSNEGEEISLYNSDGKLVDQMSYRHNRTTGEKARYWLINAVNGKRRYELKSIQRNNVHASYGGIYALQSDYFVGAPTPLKIPKGANLPYAEIYYPDDINYSLPVGCLSGAVHVTPAGGGLYEIPIEVPAGTNNFQPQLSIRYHTDMKSGLMGIGWDISGLSAIGRTSKNLYEDNKLEKIKFDGTDPLTLDGRRLVKLSGQHLDPGAVYALEKEDYSRIEIKRDDSSVYFEINRRNGEKLLYGAGTGSRIGYFDKILYWKLSRITDVYNNYIDYEYDENNGCALSCIKYGTVNSAPHTVINFIYNQINTYAKDYNLPGFVVGCQRKLLTNIQVSAMGSGTVKELIREYKFSYYDDNTSVRLAGIVLNNGQGKNLNGTLIEWEDAPNITHPQLSDYGEYMSLDDKTDDREERGALYFGDMNGDGYPDRIEIWLGTNRKGKDGYIKVYVANSWGEYNSTPSARLNFGYKKNTNYACVVKDVNNDNKEEIIFLHDNKIAVYEFNNNSLNQKYSKDFQIHDVFYGMSYAGDNSDGFPMIVINQKYDDSWNGYMYVMSTMLLFGDKNAEELSSVMEKSDFSSPPAVGRFGRDGRIYVVWGNGENKVYAETDEYAIISTTSWNIVREHYVADFNNDGLDDILFRGDDKFWHLSSNSSGPYALCDTRKTIIHNASNAVSPLERYSLYPLDYNGDGLMDVILADETYKKSGLSKYYDHTTWYFYKNTGKKFILEKTQNSSFELSSFLNAAVTDMNGDGVQDLVFSKGIEGRTYYAFTKAQAAKGYMVKRITNGMGLSNEFIYGNYNDIKNSSCNEPVHNDNAKRLVLAAYIDETGSKTSYSYSSAKRHKYKGFIGYERIISSNDFTDNKIVYEYETDLAHHIQTLKKRTETMGGYHNGTVVSEYVQKSEILKTGSGGKRYLPLIRETIMSDKLEGTTVSTNYDYDSYGNPIKEHIAAGDGTTTIEYKNYTSNVSSFPYLPREITLTKERTGQPAFRKTTKYTYTAQDNPERITEFPDTKHAFYTEYAYYPSGAIEKIKTRAYDCPEQTVDYAYDDNFRFVKTEKNVLGQVISTDYDSRYGTLKSRTDIGGLKTEYTYDGFGRIASEKQPNGQIINYSYEWDDRYGALYKTVKSCPVFETADITYYDRYGKEIRTESTGWNNNTTITRNEYNKKGELIKKVEPHFLGDEETYITYHYDVFGRLNKENYYDGDKLLATQYTYDGLTTGTTYADGTTISATKDLSGLVVEREDAGGTIYYTYNASGEPVEITANGIKTTIEYDEAGRQTSLKDPNAGTVRFGYYADGQIHYQVDAKGDSTVHIYDKAGRLSVERLYDKKATPQMIIETVYSYNDSGWGIGQVDNIVQKAGGKVTHKQKFTYNANHLPEAVTDSYENSDYTFGYGYDNLWRPYTTTSPSGLVIKNEYDAASGELTKIKAGNAIVWELKGLNARGQITAFDLNNSIMTTRHEYYRNGLLKEQYAIKKSNKSVFQHMTYGYDADTYNLISRSDIRNGRKEEFTYDKLNRLTESKLNGTVNYSLQFHDNGNIKTKNDVGTYLYDEERRPHALAGIKGGTSGAGISSIEQALTYTAFNKLSSISHSNGNADRYDIAYGLDRERIKTTYYQNGIRQYDRYYFGTYEKEVSSTGKVTEYDYIYTPSGLTAVQITAPSNSPKRGEPGLYYIYTDNLGSIQVITDKNSSIEAEYSYTAWGGRIALKNPSAGDLGGFNRGYTAHEHLEPLGLINMNGRVYDPTLARFLSPDPYVAAPDFTQGFNRYSYCFNNPFTFTDPSGEMPWLIFAGVALVSGTTNLISNWGKVNDLGSALSYFASGAVGGAIAVVNPWIGGSVTAGGNIVTDLATGHMPDFREPVEVLKYTGGVVLDGFGAVGMGQMGKQIAISTGYYYTARTTGQFVKAGPSITSEAGVAGAEVTVTGGKVGGSNLASNVVQVEKTLVNNAAKGGMKAIQAGEYTITKTVANNLATRPYINSPSTITNIMKSGKGVPDAYFKGGMNYKVPGSFNGSQGIFELGINPQTNTIYHFLFKTVK